VRRGARLLGLPLTQEGAHEIARRARGTRASRDDCSVACATSPMSPALPPSTPSSPTARYRSLKSTIAVSMRSIIAIFAASHQLRRRAGRDRDHRGGAVGAARRHRGNHRALSIAAGLHRANPARAHAHTGCVRASWLDAPTQPAQQFPLFTGSENDEQPQRTPIPPLTGRVARPKAEPGGVACAEIDPHPARSAPASQPGGGRSKWRRMSKASKSATSGSGESWPDLAGRIEGDSHVLPIASISRTRISRPRLPRQLPEFCERAGRTSSACLASTIRRWPIRRRASRRCSCAAG